MQRGLDLTQRVLLMRRRSVDLGVAVRLRQDATRLLCNGGALLLLLLVVLVFAVRRDRNLWREPASGNIMVRQAVQRRQLAPAGKLRGRAKLEGPSPSSRQAQGVCKAEAQPPPLAPPPALKVPRGYQVDMIALHQG